MSITMIGREIITSQEYAMSLKGGEFRSLLEKLYAEEYNRLKRLEMEDAMRCLPTIGGE